VDEGGREDQEEELSQRHQELEGRWKYRGIIVIGNSDFMRYTNV